MIKKIAALLLVASLFGFATAQDDPVPMLKEGDVELFIQTYPEISQQLEDLGMEYEAKTGDYDIPDSLRYDTKLREILKKHGWDENFFTVMGIIMQGYTALAYGEQQPEIDRKIADSIKEIESNPALSEAMKAQLIESMKAAQGMMADQGASMKENIHPDDLAQIEEHMDELKELLEDEE